MSNSKPKITIDQAFEAFLAEQKARVRPATFSKYRNILDLLGSCLERYWPGHEQAEYERITTAGGTFCDTFGPEEILGGLSEFLGYFMPHKVIASKATLQAAGTVTKKLVKWLGEKGYVEDDDSLKMAESRASEATRHLPASQDVLDLLDAYLDEYAPQHNSRGLEDHFMVTRVEPGKLWLDPLMSGDREIGPVPVPREISDLCKVGWDIAGTVVKTPKGWRLAEVWNVSP